MVNAIKIYFSLLFDRFLHLGKYIISTLRFTTPYIFLAINLYVGFTPLLLLFPPIIWSITSVFDIYLSSKGLGTKIPKPTERFTEDLGDGEIAVKNDRIQELILYTNELENWLRANGYTNK